MKSIFLTKAMWLIQTLIGAYKGSFTYGLVQKIQNGLNSLFKGSWVIKTMKTEAQEKVSDSWFYQKILGPLHRVLPFKRWIGQSLMLRILTSTPVLGLIWSLQIISYGFLSTRLSLLISMVLIVLFLCRLVFKPVQGPTTIFSLSALFILAMLALSGLLNPLNIDTMSILMIFTVTLLVFIIFVATVEDASMFYISLYGIGLAILLYSLYGFYQKVVGVAVDPSWLDADSDYQVMRIYSVFKNPNVFGEFLTLTLPLMFAGWQVSKKWSAKLFFFMVFVLGGVNVLLTFSRGSMVSLAIGMFLLILIRDRRYLPLFFIGLLLSPILLPESIWARLLTVTQGGDSSLDYRTSIYMASADMLKDHFVLGVGLGNFKEIYKVYAYTASKTFHAHNTFLMLWLEMGLVGLVSWLGFVFVWIKKLFTLKDRNAYSYYAVAAFVGIIGCSVQAMMEHIFHNYDILFYFFLVIAMGYLAMKLNKEAQDV